MPCIGGMEYELTQSAIVNRILGDGYAEVYVERISACGKSCASCSGGCTDKRIISVRAFNSVQAKPGEHVIIESDTKGVMGAALLVYVVPILFFFVAYMLTAIGKLGETVCIIISLGAFLLGAFCVYLFNKFVRRDKELEYKIISVE